MRQSRVDEQSDRERPQEQLSERLLGDGRHRAGGVGLTLALGAAARSERIGDDRECEDAGQQVDDALGRPTDPAERHHPRVSLDEIFGGVGADLLVVTSLA